MNQVQLTPIKSITLQNFQSHTSTTIHPALGGQLTVITGCSDSGKTAIIRALKWLLYNQPQGADFMRTGAKMCRVTVEFSDGVTVIRERTAGTNRYKIVRPGATDPEVFEGFGNSVPLEVQEITGVRTVTIADQSLLLNLSEQLDGPFLGSKQISSPGRAKILGKLAGTEEIDVASTETGRDLHRRNQDEKRLGEEIKDLETQIAEFDYLEKLAKKIERLEAICLRVKEAEVRKINLGNLKVRLHEIERQSAAACDVLLKWNGVEGAEKAVVRAERASEQSKALINLGEKLAWNNHHTQTAEIKLKQLQNLETADAAVRSAEAKLIKAKALHLAQVKLGQIGADLRHQEVILSKYAGAEKAALTVKKAEESAAKLGSLVSIKSRYIANLKQSQEAEHDAIFHGKATAEFQEEFARLLAESGTCPLCGSQIDEIKLKEAI